MTSGGTWGGDGSWDDWAPVDGPESTDPRHSSPDTWAGQGAQATTWQQPPRGYDGGQGYEPGPGFDGAGYPTGQADDWWSPTEPPRRSRALPIALGVTAAVLGVAVAGGGAWVLLGGADGSDADVVEAATATTGAWNTSAAAPTSATTTAKPTPARSVTPDCAAAEIAADISVPSPDVRNCYGDWAVAVDPSGSGDALVLRRTGGTWAVVGSPSGGCPDGRTRSEMPADLVSDVYGITCVSQASTGGDRGASAPVSRGSARPAPSDVAPRQSRPSPARSTTPLRVPASASAPAPAPAPVPAPAPAPVPAPPPPPPPAPATPPRDVAQDLRDLGNATSDLLDALEGVRTTSGEDEN